MEMSMRMTMNCNECGRELTSEESDGLRTLVALFGGENLCSGCNLPPAGEGLRPTRPMYTKIPHPSEVPPQGYTIRMPLEAKGFRVFFQNGNLASIQWSPSHYAERDLMGRPTTVEIAAMENKNGEWHHFEDNDSIKGYVPVEQVKHFLNWVGTHKLKTKPETWDGE